MSLAQLEAAQPAQSTSRSVNCTPKAPIIDPSRTLPKYQLSCIINSVCYYSDEEDHWCAVLLEVGFLPSLIQGEHFISALFPTHVPGVMLDRFPHIDEEVKMEGYNVKDGFTLSPSVQAPGGGGFNVGEISRQVDKMVYRCLRLRPQRIVHDEVRWEFVNETRHHFPSAVKLLLLVPGDSDSNSSPNFPFTLEIRPTLEVRANLKKRRWHFFQTTTILQPGPCDDGWSCEIKDDYRPRTAKDVLEEREAVLKSGKHSRMVGLHAAVPIISY